MEVTEKEVLNFKPYFTTSGMKRMFPKIYQIMIYLFNRTRCEELLDHDSSYSTLVLAGLHDYHNEKALFLINATIEGLAPYIYKYSFSSSINDTFIKYEIIENVKEEQYKVKYLSNTELNLYTFDKLINQASLKLDFDSYCKKSNMELEYNYFRIDQKELEEAKRNTTEEIYQFKIDDIIESYVYKTEPSKFITYEHVNVKVSNLYIILTKDIGYKLDFYFPNNSNISCSLIVDGEYRSNCIYGYIVENKNGEISINRDFNKTIELISSCFKQKDPE